MNIREMGRNVTPGGCHFLGFLDYDAFLYNALKCTVMVFNESLSSFLRRNKRGTRNWM